MEPSVNKTSLLKILLASMSSAFSCVINILLSIAPGLSSHLLYTCGVQLFLAVIILSSLISCFLFGMGSLIVQCIIIPPALLMYSLMKKRAAYFDIALYCAAIISATLYLMMNLGDLLSGLPPFHTMQGLFTQVWEQTLQMMRNAPAILGGTDISEYERFGASLIEKMPVFMPASICSVGALFGLSNVCLAARLNARANASIKPMSAYYRWRIPRSFVSGSSIMIAGLIAAYFLKVNLESVIPAVSVIIAFPFCVQGFGLLRFTTLKRKNSNLIFGILIALLALTLPSSLMALPLLGMVEQIFKLRERMN